MKELRDICKAYDAAVAAGKQMALATVVAVEGSSYRRAGARMLVTEDGMLTGAISGGCLEGDALRKAQLAMADQRSKLVTYDTTDEEDALIGIQLGCNGVIHILFEPVNSQSPVNPVALLKQVLTRRCDHVLVTLFNLKDRSAPHPGTCMVLHEKAHFQTSAFEEPFFNKLYGDAVMALKEQTATFSDYGDLAAHLAFIPPALSLVIAGAGNDALPLVDIAAQLGWQVTLVDGRNTHATAQRFPKADRILVSRPEQILPQIAHDHRTVYVLMTHNYNYDLAFLKMLVQQDCSYIGSLGPRKKLERMLDEMIAEGIPMREKTLQRIYGPVGLDIGAETAEEIAIAVIAEIKSVLSHKKAGFLKDRNTPIHAQERQLIHCVKDQAESTNAKSNT